MHVRRRTRAAIAAVGVATLAAGAVVTAGPAQASTPKSRIVVVHVSSTSIKLSSGTHLRPGRIEFQVRTHKGDHGLQVARLHKNYTFAQATQDLGQALSGDPAAVQRVDANITFRGGAEARKHKPGSFVITLRTGHYVFVDQNSNAYTMVNVSGKHRKAAHEHTSGSITAFTYGFGTEGTLPAKGWTRIANQSDQPHFVDFMHVKNGTTKAQVRKAFNPNNQSQPKWALPQGTSSGVISPKSSQLIKLNLPKGEYVVACFWPDSMTGMPHAYMGMWKIIHLK